MKPHVCKQYLGSLHHSSYVNPSSWPQQAFTTIVCNHGGIEKMLLTSICGLRPVSGLKNSRPVFWSIGLFESSACSCFFSFNLEAYCKSLSKTDCPDWFESFTFSFKSFAFLLIVGWKVTLQYHAIIPSSTICKKWSLVCLLAIWLPDWKQEAIK